MLLLFCKILNLNCQIAFCCFAQRPTTRRPRLRQIRRQFTLRPIRWRLNRYFTSFSLTTAWPTLSSSLLSSLYSFSSYTLFIILIIISLFFCHRRRHFYILSPLSFSSSFCSSTTLFLSSSPSSSLDSEVVSIFSMKVLKNLRISLYRSQAGMRCRLLRPQLPWLPPPVPTPSVIFRRCRPPLQPPPPPRRISSSSSNISSSPSRRVSGSPAIKATTGNPDFLSTRKWPTKFRPNLNSFIIAKSVKYPAPDRKRTR